MAKVLLENIQSISSATIPAAAIIIGPLPGDKARELVLARQIRRFQRSVPIILITEKSSEEQVIAALRANINDYFKLPCCLDEIVASVRRLVHEIPSDYKGLRKVVNPDREPALIGENRQIVHLKDYLRKVAATDSNVMITGETGTGKELAARLIHHYSDRCKQPLMAINCAALPENLLESELFGYEAGAFTGANANYEGKLRLANGGTVFLDEIGELSPCAQAKILRAIETREIYSLGGKRAMPLDFRIIAATNQDLESLLPAHKFRKDLYFRLNVVRIHLPPLRERKEDIPLLLQQYLTELSNRDGHPIQCLSEEVVACLSQYEWPGNVRELKNLAEILLINATSAPLSPVDLPEQFHRFDRSTSSVKPKPSERQLILSALHATHWNKSKAAQQLNWSRMTLYRKMVKYAIQADEAKPGSVSQPEGEVVTA